MADVLVVYYSRTGTSRRVAQEIARKENADIEEIRTSKSISFVAGALQGVMHKKPDIEPIQCDPARYKRVILITPVWAGGIASPMRTYLSANAGKLKRITVIALSQSGNGQALFDSLKTGDWKLPIEKTISIKESDVKDGSFAASI